MPFSPYHQFQNKKRLENVVSDLRDGGNITDEVFENFYRYHPSMILKLRSAKYNIERLTEKLNTTEIQDATNATGDFFFEINMFIDGFFYNSGSSLDILARVVLTLFGQPLPDKIYFESAHQILSHTHPGDTILPKLQAPAWRSDFKNYRNTLTHELILAPQYNIVIDNSRPVPTHQIVFPLPDNPRARPDDRSYRKNPNVLEYTSTHFTRILSIANKVYGIIADRAEANGILPL